ncbi:hypothetical protein S245_067875, partial [Arachis hypogaea]
FCWFVMILRHTFSYFQSIHSFAFHFLKNSITLPFSSHSSIPKSLSSLFCLIQ